ncbi:MAG TPA: hypothetical protein VHS78_17355 [Candidatus Elarobacter sp.]|nr:hypothetical protein [Candidatus Elarobacter sp.]
MVRYEETHMVPQAAFGISIALSFVAWGLVAGRYVWPALLRQRREDALSAVLTLHTFRFEGLAFLIPGVVGAGLPAAFAKAAAFGDLGAAVLALLALATLRYRTIGVAVTWVFNLWGTVDLLNAFYQANRAGVTAGELGAPYFIVTVFVPLLFVTHMMVFGLLLRRPTVKTVFAAQAA